MRKSGNMTHDRAVKRHGTVNGVSEGRVGGVGSAGVGGEGDSACDQTVSCMSELGVPL